MVQPVAFTVETTLVVDVPQIDEQLTTLYWQNTAGAWTPTMYTALMLELEDRWEAQIAPLLPTDCEFIEIRWRDLTAIGNPRYTYVIAPPVAGTGSGNAVPATAPAVVKLIGTGGGAVGSSYINQGPVLESAIVLNQLTSAARNAYTLAVYNLTAPITSGADTLSSVIISRILNGAERVPPVTNTVASATTRQLIGRRHSRLI